MRKTTTSFHLKSATVPSEWWKGWFISGAKHREVITHYEAVIAQLRSQLPELQKESDAQLLTSLIDHGIGRRKGRNDDSRALTSATMATISSASILAADPLARETNERLMRCPPSKHEEELPWLKGEIEQRGSLAGNTLRLQSGYYRICRTFWQFG
jgi:hypothetical protein